MNGVLGIFMPLIQLVKLMIIMTTTVFIGHATFSAIVVFIFEEIHSHPVPHAIMHLHGQS